MSLISKVNINRKFLVRLRHSTLRWVILGRAFDKIKKNINESYNAIKSNQICQKMKDLSQFYLITGCWMTQNLTQNPRKYFEQSESSQHRYEWQTMRKASMSSLLTTWSTLTAFLSSFRVPVRCQRSWPSSLTNVKWNTIQSTSTSMVSKFLVWFCPFWISCLTYQVSILSVDKESILSYMNERTGQSLLPIVFLNGQHLGGYDNVIEAHEQGRLLNESGT